jgi:hypothetical protein
MDNFSQGNININKTFIISSTPVTPFNPCTGIITADIVSCDSIIFFKINVKYSLINKVFNIYI